MSINIIPKIVTVSKKKLIGTSISMSLSENKTFDLFSNFMPRRKEIINKISNDVFDMRVYSPNHFDDFSPVSTFTKWALMEVSDFENVPVGMKLFILERGLYAVFHYKGLGTDSNIFRYIFESWLPNSNYILDHRPHFEVMGEKYKNNDPNSEEDIYIPLKLKS